MGLRKRLARRAEEAARQKTSINRAERRWLTPAQEKALLDAVRNIVSKGR